MRKLKCSQLILGLLFFFSLNSYSQDLQRIDASILLYPKSFDSPEALSKFITRDYKTDEEKVRAIYSWIIQNIAYDPEEYKQFNYSFKNYRERNDKEEKTREKIIERTLKYGTAVCEGYAMLFEKLCELQGINNYLVRGDTKTNFDDIGRPFARTHMWNVAEIDGQQYLFDATWGAGKYRGKFIKEPSYFFYKTPPDLFIKTHFPDLYEDAFLDVEISPAAFSEMPLIIAESLRMEELEKPFYGIIEMDAYYDSVPFSIANVQPVIIEYSYGKELKSVQDMVISDGKLTFSVPLELGVNTLLIYFDNEPALGYRIK